MIGWHNSRYFSTNKKQNHNYRKLLARVFPHLAPLSSDVLILLFSSVVIGQGNFFGSGFTTAELKPFNIANRSDVLKYALTAKIIKEISRFTKGLNFRCELIGADFFLELPCIYLKSRKVRHPAMFATYVLITDKCYRTLYLACLLTDCLTVEFGL